MCCLEYIQHLLFPVRPILQESEGSRLAQAYEEDNPCAKLAYCTQQCLVKSRESSRETQ
jgi:hypothetical protein